jgi:hypothetical protein
MRNATHFRTPKYIIPDAAVKIANFKEYAFRSVGVGGGGGGCSISQP